MARQLPIIAKLREEINSLKKELSVDIPRLLEEARAHGDLSENADYEATKERQGMLHARISKLTERLESLAVYSFSSIPEGVIGYGSRVELEDCESGERFHYEIVFAEEADPARGLISLSSPFAQALLKHGNGDEVAVRSPSGLRTFEVVGLATLHKRKD